MPPLPARGVALGPVDHKRPPPGAPCTAPAVGAGDTDGRRSRRWAHRVDRSVAGPVVGHHDQPGHARVCRGEAALEGGAGPPVTQDGHRPRRGSLPGPRDAMRAAHPSARAVRRRGPSRCCDRHHSASASGPALAGRSRAQHAGVARLRAGCSPLGRRRVHATRSCRAGAPPWA